MKSIIAWVGGKSQLREKIIAEFPPNFKMYVEVFGGAAWVLLARDKHAKEEIYNDFNSDLVNLFRCIKYHAEELKRELKYMLSSRENFSDYKELIELKGLTDIQRASKFFYLIRSSFGAKGQHYATRGRSLDNNIAKFDDLAKRLNKVVIENKDFEELIKLYDKEDTFFYLDPPYFGTEKYYNSRDILFTKKDHERLRDLLKGIKGKFLLSYNNCKEIKELYEGYSILEVSRKEILSKAGKNKSDYNEILIKNY